MSNRLGSVLLALLMCTGSFMAVLVAVPAPAGALSVTVTTDEDFLGSEGNAGTLDNVVVDGGSIKLGEDKYTIKDVAWSAQNARDMVVDGNGIPKLDLDTPWKRRTGYGSDGCFWHTTVWDSTRGKVYLYGGRHDSGTTMFLHNALWEYDPAMDTWTERQGGPAAVYGHTAVWADELGMMIVYGGISVSGQNLVFMDYVLLYWPANNSWAVRQRAPVHLTWHSAAWDPLNHQMLVSGGTPDGNLSNATQNLYSYNPSTDSWSQLAGMGSTMARGGHVAVWDTDREEMIISGGRKSNRPMSSTMTYKPSSNSWTTRDNSPLARFLHGASWDPVQKRMYVYGGIDDGWNPSAQFHYFSNSANTWTTMRPGLSSKFFTAFVWDPLHAMGMNFMGAQSGNGPYVSYNEVLVFKEETLYKTSGWLTGPIYDVGGILRVGNITWKPLTQAASCGPDAVTFQVGSSGPLESPDTFLGPDGTTESFFTDPEGASVGSAHLGMNRIAYRMLFKTADPTISPTVTEVGMEVFRYKLRGTYTSPVQDLVQPVSTIGRVRYSSEIPAGGNPNLIKTDVYIRTSSRSDMASATDWELVTADDASIKTAYARYFQFKVEFFTDSQARYLTPLFKEISLDYNSPPVLSRPQVDRSEGDRSTWFEYSITYTDVDNDAPTVRNVHIDGSAYVMSSSDTTYTDGAVFSFTTRLSLGAHTFHFEFSDGKNNVREPSIGTFDGPKVVNLAPKPVIDYPAGGSRYSPEEPIEFSASRSSDPEGDPITYKWTSSLLGQISDKSAFVMKLSQGMHTITLEVRDDKGGVNSTEISLDVRPYLPVLDVTDVYFDNTAPIEKDRVTITAVVRNSGEAAARPAFIELLVDMVVVETAEENLDIGERANVVFQLTAEAGRPLVSVRAKRAVDAEPDSEVKRFLNITSNSPPDVRFDIPDPVVKKGDVVLFVNNGTRDPDGDTLSYEWDFGDGSPPVRDVTVQHVYSYAGTYYVNLTVRDTRGGVTTKTYTVVVEEPKKDDGPGLTGPAALVAVGAVAAAMAVARVDRRRRRPQG